MGKAQQTSVLVDANRANQVVPVSKRGVLGCTMEFSDWFILLLVDCFAGIAFLYIGLGCTGRRPTPAMAQKFIIKSHLPMLQQLQKTQSTAYLQASKTTIACGYPSLYALCLALVKEYTAILY